MGQEQRTSARVAVEYEGKLWRPWVARSIECTTVDVSETGVLVMARGLTPLRAGEEISIGISTGEEAVLEESDLIACEVVRAGRANLPVQPVALRFKTPRWGLGISGPRERAA